MNTVRQNSITRSQHAPKRIDYSQWSFEELRELAMQLRLRDVIGKSRRELLEIFVTRRRDPVASQAVSIR
jgi:hypothetical protein